MQEEICKNPRQFSFTQIIRILAHEQNQHFDRFLRERIRVRPQLSLGFPGVDVVDVARRADSDGEKFQITASFLGLYGASSPLPTFYTEDLIDDVQDEIEVTRDFLDIFHTVFYRLYYLGWSKYRWDIKLIDEGNEDYLERLYCLLGLGESRVRETLGVDESLLRYIGLFTQQPHSVSGLRSLVRDITGSEDVQIRSCLPASLSIAEDEKCLLGMQGCGLGENSSIGLEVEYISGRIAIDIRQMDIAAFYLLLPGASRFRYLQKVLGIYLNQPLECRLCLELRPKESRTASLGGQKWSALGFDTWIFSGSMDDPARAAFDLQLD